MQKFAQLMEARKRDSGDMEIDFPQSFLSHHMQQSSHSSGSSSDSLSPAQSTFSSRGYSRSSASSAASSPGYRDSLDGYSSSKRPLTDVKEEPQEREEAVGLVSADQFFDRNFSQSTHHLVQSPAAWDYVVQHDADQQYSDSDLFASQSTKKRRSGDSPLSGVTARIGTRFPSLSRKWKSRSGVEPSLTVDLLEDPMRSRASSTGSTIISPTLSTMTKHDSYLPPSPARTVFEESIRDSGIAPIDIAKANEHTDDEEDSLARTPLLPPLMVNFPEHLKESPVQSPLPSPTVAEASTTSIIHTPIDTPRLTSLPSPPLSTKPSMSSLHRQRIPQTLSLVDLPPISMPDPEDEWSQKLGHANFHIHPEPYLPEVIDVESYKQLRANWDLARCSYARHLVRTDEHNGSTSKIYKLTEEKWAQVDAHWKRNNATVLSGLDESSTEVLELSRSNVGPVPPIKIPLLNDPQGKFPELGDEDIVGPMTVGPVIKIPSPTQGRQSKKRTFLKFLQDFKTNTGLLLGRASANTSR